MQAKFYGVKAHIEQDIKKQLQETQNIISASLMAKHKMEIYMLKKAYDE